MIFDTWVKLKVTKARHYTVYILPLQGRPRPPTTKLRATNLQPNMQINLQEQEFQLKSRYKGTQDAPDDSEPKEIPKDEGPAPKKLKEPRAPERRKKSQTRRRSRKGKKGLKNLKRSRFDRKTPKSMLKTRKREKNY